MYLFGFGSAFWGCRVLRSDGLMLAVLCEGTRDGESEVRLRV